MKRGNVIEKHNFSPAGNEQENSRLLRFARKDEFSAPASASEIASLPHSVFARSLRRSNLGMGQGYAEKKSRLLRGQMGNYPAEIASSSAEADSSQRRGMRLLRAYLDACPRKDEKGKDGWAAPRKDDFFCPPRLLRRIFRDCFGRGKCNGLGYTQKFTPALAKTKKAMTVSGARLQRRRG